MSDQRDILSTTLLIEGSKELTKVRRGLEGADVTFAVVLVNVHRLAQAKGAEGHHVFVGVE